LTTKAHFFSKSWKTISSFDPQIIHYVPGASIRNLMLMRVLKLRNRAAKTITSVQQIHFPHSLDTIIPWLKPDILLVQSQKTEAFFSKAKCRTSFLPNGVNTSRFEPVSGETKRRLREKHGIDQKAFIALHVGPLRRWRNTDALSHIQRQGIWQILAIASITNPSESEAARQLEQSGCLVRKDYFANIEEVYALSDCYIFTPTHHLGSIETPLSVMEAMSCNIPVISTRYGALPRIFSEGDGLYFADSPSEFGQLLSRVQTNHTQINTRMKVTPYSWESIVQRLEQIYREILED